MKVLITAFEPFGRDSINSSAKILEKLPGKVGGAEIVTRLLPVVYEKDTDILYKAIELEKPDAVICMGQAASRGDIGVERLAVNIKSASTPDNDGNRPVDELINPAGPVGYFSTLPVGSIITAVKEKGVPASVSHFAGTYLCNHVFYGLMDYISTNKPEMQGGFIHVPIIPEQGELHPGAPSIELDNLLNGIIAAVGAIERAAESR